MNDYDLKLFEDAMRYRKLVDHVRDAQTFLLTASKVKETVEVTIQPKKGIQIKLEAENLNDLMDAVVIWN